MSQPTGMCLTDGQILAGQVGDAVPFSRINRRFEEFDVNSIGEPPRFKPRVPRVRQEKSTRVSRVFLPTSPVCIVRRFVCFRIFLLCFRLFFIFFPLVFDRGTRTVYFGNQVICRLALALLEHFLRSNVSAFLIFVKCFQNVCSSSVSSRRYIQKLCRKVLKKRVRIFIYHLDGNFSSINELLRSHFDELQNIDN